MTIWDGNGDRVKVDAEREKILDRAASFDGISLYG